MAGIVADARQLSDILRDVAEFASQAIPGVDGVGVTLIKSNEPRPRIQTWAVTAAFVEEIDTAQYEDLDEGPCLTSMQSQRPAVSGSLGSDPRWPHFGGRVARMGGTPAGLTAGGGQPGHRCHQLVCIWSRRVRRSCGAARITVRTTGRGVGVPRTAIG